ncbi:9597_t:CDS:2 [Paraglomus brasilianum]|uniref:9597_t:CDS:1 n=1 Tax=Paraglomus brasilianum TaxID=144538 RepID=A0A9N9BA24_9GLOM|nr:9597_t:CDS:2 [Paraglomus brasilianum]
MSRGLLVTILVSGYKETVMHIATALFFMTQFMFSYCAVILNIQIEDERERVVNEFNVTDQRRGVKWNYYRRPSWLFNFKQSYILAKLDDSLRNRSF